MLHLKQSYRIEPEQCYVDKWESPGSRSVSDPFLFPFTTTPDLMGSFAPARAPASWHQMETLLLIGLASYSSMSLEPVRSNESNGAEAWVEPGYRCSC